MSQGQGQDSNNELQPPLKAEVRTPEYLQDNLWCVVPSVTSTGSPPLCMKVPSTSHKEGFRGMWLGAARLHQSPP